MFICQAQGLSFHYPDQPNAILENLNFVIHSHSKIGLVGDNGAGKSTLLALLRQTLTPASGQILWGHGHTLGWLPQRQPFTAAPLGRQIMWRTQGELYLLYLKMQDIHCEGFDWELFERYQHQGGYALEAKTLRILTKLGLNESHLERTTQQLSGGEQTRLAIGALLLDDPSVLLLDEPANHLDEAHIVWLEQFIHNCDIPYLLIGHDRQLLDRCCNTIWYLHQGQLICQQGNYSDYCQHQQQRTELQRLQWQEKANKVQKLTQRYHHKQQLHTRMDRFKASRSIKNNGALCKRDDGSIRGSAHPGKVARQAKVIGQRVSRLQQDLAQNKPWQEKSRTLRLHNQSELRCRFLLQVEQLEFAPILPPLSFSLRPGDRLHLDGPNGCGKSTLLALVANIASATAGRITYDGRASIHYLPQQLALHGQHSLRQRLDFTTRQLEQEMFTLLAVLGLSEQILDRADDQLSEGQRVKCRLLEALLEHSDLLLLDEPTNHLEISVRERLAAGLKQFPGAVIFASHDRYFAQELATCRLSYQPQGWQWLAIE